MPYSSIIRNLKWGRRMDTINNIETAKKRFIDYLDEAVENEMRNTIYLISDVAISEIFNPEQIKNLRKKIIL